MSEECGSILTGTGSLEAAFNFNSLFPSCDPTTPPTLTLDPSLLEMATDIGHSRSSSCASVFSFESSSPNSIPSTRRTSPARSPIRIHGPLLLPKIRSQDQNMDPHHMPFPGTKPVTRRARTTLPTVRKLSSPYKAARQPSHRRSNTNPETISCSTSASSLLESSIFTLQTDAHQVGRRASSCQLHASNDAYNLGSDRKASNLRLQPRAHLQTAIPRPETFMYQQPYELGTCPPPLSAASMAVEAPAASTLLSYLTGPNPAPSLVHSISFPLKDPNMKHFWWDVRQVRPWTEFSASSILSLPGASDLLSCPIPAPLLPNSMPTQRHPENEAALYSIYASYFLPKINSALQLSSQRPLQLSVPGRNACTMAAGGGVQNVGTATGCMFVADAAGDSSSATNLFGGKPAARLVGLVKSFDRFNSGMRVEGNVKRVEYLRGLAHLHHAMREHGCRYGFILTEIELVVARNGVDEVPHFGLLELANIQLATRDVDPHVPHVTLTACLALWGLCMMAGDNAPAGCAHWRSNIGAPAEGSRKKALPPDEWMPQPQLGEKREAKRARGWVWPEDAIGRKEMGRRGVRYGACAG